MNCYSHTESIAIGICKSCNKAVCKDCAIDTGLGLACAEECVKEVNDYNLTMKKAKQLYGLGEGGQKIPTGILLFWAIGAIIFGTGVYRYIAYEKLDFISLLMGGVFLILGYVGYARNKKVGISC
jgi:hypothetical protein